MPRVNIGFRQTRPEDYKSPEEYAYTEIWRLAEFLRNEVHRLEERIRELEKPAEEDD